MLGPRTKKFLTNDAKHKLRAFSNAYTFNNQDDVYTMFFVIVKMVLPDTHAECSDIKSNLEIMKMYQLKNDTPRANLQISEWMNKIPISGETYSYIVRRKFKLYSTS